jgi:LPS-assembly lipoprotein
MRRILLPLTGAALLSACGLHPLYGGGSAGPAAIGFRSIDVASIPQRTGWFTRNAIVDRLGGEHPGGSYRLDVDLDDNITSFGIRGDSATTRERRTLRARYRLIERSTGAVVLDASAGADAGIDVVSSEYATVAAEQTTAERLSQQVADQIVIRLARYLTAAPAGR